MDTIREEFDRLRDLTKEFQELKLELAARNTVRSPRGDGNFDGPGRLEARRCRDSLESKKRDNAGTTVRSVLSIARVGPAPGPATSAWPPPSGMGSSSSGDALPALAVPQSARAPSSQSPSTASWRRVKPMPDRLRHAAGGSNPESDRDVMIWLHQRMMTLQQERETRWQKILKLLPGLS